MKEGCRTCKILHTRKQSFKLLTFKHVLPFPKGTKEYSQALKSNGVCFARFKNWGNQWYLFSFYFLPFGMGMSITGTLSLSHHCILERVTCFLASKINTEEEEFCLTNFTSYPKSQPCLI